VRQIKIIILKTQENNSHEYIILDVSTTTVSLAIMEATKVFFEKSFLLSLIIYGERTAHLEDIISKIAIADKSSLKIRHQRNINILLTNFESSAVILTSDVENVNIFNDRAAPMIELPVRFRYLIYIENYSEKDLRLPPYNFVNLLAVGQVTQFEYFIIRTKDSVDLKAIRFFSEMSCHQTQLLRLDSFDVRKQKWQNDLKNLEHFKQFHGCTLPFYVYYSHMFYFNDFELKINDLKNLRSRDMKKIQLHAEKRNIKYDGLVHTMIMRMAKVSNFTPTFKINYPSLEEIDLNSSIGDFFEIMDYTPPFKHEYFHLTKTFASDRRQFTFTQTESLSNFHKLFFCFDRTTWIVIGLIFAITFITIFIVNCMSKSIQDIFFGTDIRMPSYNVFGTFFGISQTRLPKESFARLLLTFFIFFCFMIRTLYQSMLFDFIATDIKMPLPNSFEEIITANYTIDYYKEELATNATRTGTKLFNNQM
jgi:hypothetical protein